MRQARETVRLYHPLMIVTDKAHSYAKVIGEINDRLGPEDVNHSPVGHFETKCPERSEASPGL